MYGLWYGTYEHEERSLITRPTLGGHVLTEPVDALYDPHMA